MLVGVLAAVFVGLHVVLMMRRHRRQRCPGQYYRAGVGIVVVNERGEVLALERSENPGSWQLPQGGLEEGEEPDDAATRELHEETGLKVGELSLLNSRPLLVAYELPPEHRSIKTGRGQVLHWFFYQLEGSNTLIGIGDGKEFRRWKWVRMSDLMLDVVDFRRAAYRQVAEELGLLTRQKQHAPEL